MKRSLRELRGHGLSVEFLVTDRHRSIIAYLRDKEGHIIHFFDCWHVAKCENLGCVWDSIPSACYISVYVAAAVSKFLEATGKLKLHKEYLTPERIRSIISR